MNENRPDRSPPYTVRHRQPEPIWSLRTRSSLLQRVCSYEYRFPHPTTPKRGARTLSRGLVGPQRQRSVGQFLNPPGQQAEPDEDLSRDEEPVSHPCRADNASGVIRRFLGWCFCAASVCAEILGFAPSGESLLGAPKGTKRARPGIRVFASLRLPSLRYRSEGRLARAIHGPSSLSRHPCRSPLCAIPPLGLLTGLCARLGLWLLHACSS